MNANKVQHADLSREQTLGGCLRIPLTSYEHQFSNLQGECTVTESPIFFKLCEIKVSLCSKKMTNPYDPLFRNTRENRVKILEDICSYSYSLFRAVFYKV